MYLVIWAEPLSSLLSLPQTLTIFFRGSYASGSKILKSYADTPYSRNLYLEEQMMVALFQAGLYITDLQSKFSRDKKSKYLLQGSLQCSAMIKMRSNPVPIFSVP